MLEGVQHRLYVVNTNFDQADFTSLMFFLFHNLMEKNQAFSRNT